MYIFLAPEGKGNDGVSAFTRSSLEPGEEFGFEVVGVRVEFAGGDLIGRCSLEAKVTDAEAALGAYGWPEYAAGHRTGCVQITSASLWIKRRARLVVGIVFELLAARGENSGGRVAWKISTQAADCGAGAPAHPPGPLGLMLLQVGETFL